MELFEVSKRSLNLHVPFEQALEFRGHVICDHCRILWFLGHRVKILHEHDLHRKVEFESESDGNDTTHVLDKLPIIANKVRARYHHPHPPRLIKQLIQSSISPFPLLDLINSQA